MCVPLCASVQGSRCKTEGYRHREDNSTATYMPAIPATETGSSHVQGPSELQGKFKAM